MRQFRRMAIVLSAMALLIPARLSAAQEAIEFRGSGYLQDFSEECAAGGYTDAVYVNARFRPRGIGANGKNTRISFFLGQFYATSYELPRGKLKKSFRDAVGGATGSVTTFFENKPRIRLVEIEPRAIKRKTDGLLMSGQIENFDGIEGCGAFFDLSLRRQP